MIYAGILAAGKGTRMHRQDLPKPFLPLGEKPILVHTMEQFVMNPQIDHIVVVVADDWLQYTEDLLAKYRLTSKPYSVIAGGAIKTESIGIIAKCIEAEFGIKDGDILVAHDAIRPFVTQRIIEDNIAVAKKFGAANTAMKMNDSILTIENNERVSDVPQHDTIFAEQTPQSYSLAKLTALLSRVREQGIKLSYETEFPRLWISMGYEMGMVRGEYFNMKIINPYDLEVANALLKEHEK